MYITLGLGFAFCLWSLMPETTSSSSYGAAVVGPHRGVFVHFSHARVVYDRGRLQRCFI
jgi:hypothetical protein